MVKANGYGAGATEIAKTLLYHRCDYLAVAVAERVFSSEMKVSRYR